MVKLICTLENNYVSKFLLKLEILCLLFVDQILSQAHWKIYWASSLTFLEPTKSKQKVNKTRKRAIEGKKELLEV